MTLPPPGSIVVIEATLPDGLPSLRRGTVVASDDKRLGLHVRAGLLADLRLLPGSLLRLHWGHTSDVHGSMQAIVSSADAKVDPEGVVDGVVMAHLIGPQNDRRAHGRVRVPGTVLWEGGEGSLVDLSAGGLRLETSDEIDGPLAMIVEVAGRHLAVKAEPVGRDGGEIRLVVESSASGDLDDVVTGLVTALTLTPPAA